MANVTIIGGHGKVALLAEPMLRERGHTVNAIIRSEDQSADIMATGANPCLLYTSPSPRDRQKSRMPSSA